MELTTHYASEVVCFVAGTPVWTDKGLVAIEKIKVGDLVLSKCEKTGVQAYKKVTKTFKTENQPICAINYGMPYKGKMRREFVFCTPEHPFWIKDMGWMNISQIYKHNDGGDVPIRTFAHIETTSGEHATMSWMRNSLGVNVQQSLKGRNIGVILTSDYYSDQWGEELEFDGGQVYVNVDYEDATRKDYGETIFYGVSGKLDTDFLSSFQNEISDPLPHFLTTVYNIEVADFHTYYVGEIGVWVKNTCKSHAQ